MSDTTSGIAFMDTLNSAESATEVTTQKVDFKSNWAGNGSYSLNIMVPLPFRSST